jgi:hypothetical protein
MASFKPLEEYLILASIEKALRDHGFTRDVTVTAFSISEKIAPVIDMIVEQRVAARNRPVPPPVPLPYPERLGSEKPECSQCGLVLEEVMHYVCASTKCPTGLGGPVCIS